MKFIISKKMNYNLTIFFYNKKMEENVSDLLEKIRNLEENKKKFNLEIDKQIINLEKKIFELCNHDWIIDRSNAGEHTEYICSICFQYK